jgi:DNA (cytosine-5)-methyltransferase 1
VRSIELFAGAGGLAIATAHAGFQHEAVFEWDRDACRTLRLNARSGSGHAGDWNVVPDDVANVDFRPYQGSIEPTA